MHITEYFPKAYAINLKSRTDRRREMDRMLKRAGLADPPGWVEYFPGVKVDSAEGFPNAGARGCFLGHLGVFKKALDEGLPNVLVMEDDLEITPEFLDRADAIVDELRRRENWGFAYFGHILNDEPHHDPVVPLRLVTGPVSMGHFYALNGPVIPRLIEYFEAVLTRPPGHPDGGPMFNDGACSMFRERNPDVLTLVAQPNMGRQRSSRSDISAQWFDKLPGVGGLAGVARSVKRWARG